MSSLMPFRNSCLPASLGTSPYPAATSSSEKCFSPTAVATRSIRLRVVETPPNQRLMRQRSLEGSVDFVSRAAIGVEDLRGIDALHGDRNQDSFGDARASFLSTAGQSWSDLG